MPRHPRRLILSEDQVVAFSRNLYRIALTIKNEEPYVKIRTIRLKRLTPVKALRNMAMYLEELYKEQQGQKRKVLAWDFEQATPHGYAIKEQQAKTRLKTGRKTP